MLSCRARLAMVGVIPLLGGVHPTRSVAAASICPAAATVTIVADNRSADATVTVSVSGTRVSSSGGCDATGTGLATSYSVDLPCSGSGVVTCGRVPGLAPGTWVHRVSTQVAGSAPQKQARRDAVLARTAAGVSNVVEWTVHGRSFVVDAATDTSLLGALDAAAAYTTSSGRSALVRFDDAVFPGVSAPTTIDVKHTVTQPGNIHSCGPDVLCGDGRHTAYCLEAPRVTVDALDDDGLTGGVILRVGTCSRSLLRIYGDDTVLRGLVLEGSSNPAPSIPVDTIAFGGGTRRSRLERSVVRGPTLGDAVSVQDNAGQANGTTPCDVVVADSEILGAEDKGLKSVYGGIARLERTCVHDNNNGGVQATLGGGVTAIENVVQHNVGGPSQNGLLSGVPNPGSPPNALVTRGNVVRFNGARGISIVNTGVATLASDVVSDNYQAGVRIESVVANEQPSATVRGGAFTCNYAPGACSDATACRVDEDCADMMCAAGPAGSLAKGTGAALEQCVAAGCRVPLGDFGTTSDSGRNAFTKNVHPGATAPVGVNFGVVLAELVTVSAAGNQWEHCSTPATNPGDASQCNVAQVMTLDVRANGPTIALGAPTNPGSGPAPTLTGISPGRPRAGELVRVYGSEFDAIAGAACAPAGLPDPCSAENAASVALNASVAGGTRATVTIGDPPVAFDAPVHAITPTMLIVAMPIDCYAPGHLVVKRGTLSSAAIPICDPGGCVGRETGNPCDDVDDVCTLGEACTAGGQCLGVALDCDDHNPCTIDGCDPGVGCTNTVLPDGSTCGPGDACQPAPTCAASVCIPPPATVCDDGDVCTEDSCAVPSGCEATPLMGMPGIACRFAQMRALIDEAKTHSRRVARRLLARTRCGERRAERADAAASEAARLRQARRALSCLAKYDSLARRSPKLDDDLRLGLRREGQLASDAIAETFGVP